MKTKLFFALSILTLSAPFIAQASLSQSALIPQDSALNPQINILGSGVVTLETTRAKNASANFSDSSLLVGASEKLYQGSGVGSLGLGWITLDETTQGLQTQLYLNHAFVNYESERYEFRLGRSDTPSAHPLDFPTLRGDDLITLLSPLNPFSNGKNSEEHRYSNSASFTINQNLKMFESIHLEHLINSAGIGSSSNINSVGTSIEMKGTPGMEAFERFPTYGFGYNHAILSSATSPSGIHQAFASARMNLNESVTERFDLGFSDILSLGSDLSSLLNTTDSFQANSNSLALTLRYLSQPFGHPGYELGLTAAYKNYFKITQAKSYGVALSGSKHLGQGFDLVAEYLGQRREGSLATVQSSGNIYEQTFELGLVFNFNAAFNEHLAPRRSILNMEHEYHAN